MRCSNTVVHWLNILLFDILLDNSTAGVCVRSVKLSVRMLTSATIKPWACLHRQAHVRWDRTAHKPCCVPPSWAAQARGSSLSTPGSTPRSAGHPHCLHGGEQSTETRPLDVCALLLLIASLLLLLQTAPSFCVLSCYLLGLSFSTVFFKIRRHVCNRPSSSQCLTFF